MEASRFRVWGSGFRGYLGVKGYIWGTIFKI